MPEKIHLLAKDLVLLEATKLLALEKSDASLRKRANSLISR